MIPKRLVGVVLVVAALLLFAAPFAPWPHYGETPHFVYATETDDPDGPVTDYEDLSPEAQAIFDAQFTDESGMMYSETDAELISTFRALEYLRYERRAYHVSVVHADGAWVFVTPIRLAMFGLGAVLGIVGLALVLSVSPDADFPG